VGDNTDVLIMKEGLTLVKRKLLGVLKELRAFAMAHRDLPTLAYTHLQPAQLTTVGKRATLWMNELLMDFEEVEHRLTTLALMGSKASTGSWPVL
jgi:adenylosuccinate lyase